MKKIRKILNWCGYNRRGIYVILSVIALILSIISICYVFQRDGKPPFDYQGVFVAIFSLLVTLLIGWQIYNAMEVKAQLKQMQELYRDLPFLIQAQTNLVKAIGIFRCGKGRNEAEALKIGVMALQNAVNIKSDEKNQTVQAIVEFIKNDVIPSLTHEDEINVLLNASQEINRMNRFIGFIDLVECVQNKISELQQKYLEKLTDCRIRQ